MKMLTDARTTMARAFGTTLDGWLEAGLVAAPFAGLLGIWVNALTWWPNMLTLTLTAVVWVAMLLWVAGSRVAEYVE